MAQDAQAQLDANKALVRRWFEEVINQGDFAVFDEICTVCAPSATMIQGVVPNAPKGIEGARQMVNIFRTAFPDGRWIVEEQLAEGNKVLTRMTVEGTMDGELMGMPPTGKRMSVSAMSLWTVAGGHLVSEVVNWDMLGALQQLGLAPSPAPAGA